MAERGYKRRKYYIHEIQKEYAILIVILLLVYTVILGLFLFGPPAIKLFTDVPLTERAEAAANIFLFAERLWPAVIITLFLSSLVSIYVTNRVGGPIHRFEQMIKRVMLGDISARVKLRENDRLIYLSKLLNQMVDSINTPITDIRQETIEMKKILEKILPELESKAEIGIISDIESIAAHRDRIETVLAKFKVSSFKEAEPLK
ncbi:MAG: methyl-accepting chemotaxis protein [Deltaproteobacteria bacterium]|nr:methyl-accepting chemotaxis protein [Deltaproteobacteria bacterium]